MHLPRAVCLPRRAHARLNLIDHEVFLWLKSDQQAANPNGTSCGQQPVMEESFVGSDASVAVLRELPCRRRPSNQLTGSAN